MCRFRSVPRVRTLSAHSLAAANLRLSATVVVIAAPLSGQALSLHSRAWLHPIASLSCQSLRSLQNHRPSPSKSPSPSSQAAGYIRSISRTAPPQALLPAHSLRGFPPESAPAPTTAAAIRTAATTPDSLPAARLDPGPRSLAAGYSRRLPS